MNHVDIILAIPLAIGAIRGFVKGFVHEIASLISLIAGVYFAAIFAEMAGGYLGEYVDWNPYAVKIVAFITIFIVVVIVIKLIARIIEKVFKLVGINFLNRIAGVVAGTLKMAFILSIILIFLNYLNRENLIMSDETRESSFLYDKVAALAPSVMPAMSFRIDPQESDTNQLIVEVE
jgi:membrane protein required for colicin V production